MTKSRFDTEQEANGYKLKHQLVNRVAEPIGGGKWGLVFPIESHIQVNDGAPVGMRQHEVKVLNFAAGEWNHLFGVGSKATRCRIVIDLEQSKMIAAQEWTGLKFENLRGVRLKDLAESVIEVNEAHANLDDWNLALTSDLPAWAEQREMPNCTFTENLNPAWSNVHSEAAQREGWDIFDTRGSDSGPWQIQRFDDATDVPGAPQLKDDEAAFRIVLHGSAAHHGAAREFIRAHNPNEWAALTERVMSLFIERPPSVSAAPGPKLYRAEVHGGGDLNVSPSVAVFQVDEQLARDIIKFALLVKANDVYKIERFDYRAEFFQFDRESAPDDAEEAGDGNAVRTDCDCLVVTDSEFFFRADVKHTDVGVECRAQSILDLAKHFGLPFGDPDASQIEVQTQAQPGTDLSGVDAYALQCELKRRGLLVQLWSPEDFEFIGNDDEEAADLPADTLDKIQQQAFEQCRRSLDEITAQRGNEHLGDWWAMNKQPILSQFKVKDEAPSPGM